MTEDLTTFSPEDRVNSVLEEMNKFSFDVAPIEISGHIRKYVRRKDLKGVSETDRIIGHAEPLEEDDLLGSEVPVIDPSPGSRDLLNIMDERDKRFAFILRDGIEGIITHADLNSVQAGVPLYQLISEYEGAACDLIYDEIEHGRWLSHLTDNEQGEIEDIYQRQVDQDADLRLVDCLNTRQINEIVREYELVDRLGFEEDQAKEVLDDIEGLRNDVMHQRSVVGKHTFSEFVEIVSDLKLVNQALK
ncbi:CBS domain-containing protein [Halonotius pteroides]|nr:CBS domain-containing protein [Halonotius pteroides]